MTYGAFCSHPQPFECSQDNSISSLPAPLRLPPILPPPLLPKPPYTNPIPIHAARQLFDGAALRTRKDLFLSPTIPIQSNSFRLAFHLSQDSFFLRF